jgi:hypothetical protein
MIRTTGLLTTVFSSFCPGDPARITRSLLTLWNTADIQKSEENGIQNIIFLKVILVCNISSLQLLRAVDSLVDNTPIFHTSLWLYM